MLKTTRDLFMCTALEWTATNVHQTVGYNVQFFCTHQYRCLFSLSISRSGSGSRSLLNLILKFIHRCILFNEKWVNGCTLISSWCKISHNIFQYVIQYSLFIDDWMRVERHPPVSSSIFKLTTISKGRALTIWPWQMWTISIQIKTTTKKLDTIIVPFPPNQTSKKVFFLILCFQIRKTTCWKLTIYWNPCTSNRLVAPTHACIFKNHRFGQSQIENQFSFMT